MSISMSTKMKKKMVTIMMMSSRSRRQRLVPVRLVLSRPVPIETNESETIGL